MGSRRGLPALLALVCLLGFGSLRADFIQIDGFVPVMPEASRGLTFYPLPATSTTTNGATFTETGGRAKVTLGGNGNTAGALLMTYSFPSPIDLTDGDDPVTADSDVCPISRRSGAVQHESVLDHDVKHCTPIIRLGMGLCPRRDGMMLLLPAKQTAVSQQEGVKESRMNMNMMIKITMPFIMLGFLAFPIIVAFFAWQRGLGSTH